MLNPGAIEAALARPLAVFGGEALFSDDVMRVAVLIHAITTTHPFIDGNKRTALVAGDFVLRLNGRRIVPSDETEPFFWSIARGETSPDDIRAWLASRTESWRASL